MSNRVCVALASVILLICGCHPQGKAADHEGSSQSVHGIQYVVFITIDTLRADHVGCYGHPFVQTPSLDRLASEGVRFTNQFSAVSTTLSSHTSMMTGTYPHKHGVVRNGYVVNDKNRMLAEILRDAGFVTAGFVGGVPLAPTTNFQQGFDCYNADFTRGVPGRGGGRQRRADEVTDAVCAWLEKHWTDQNTDRDRLFLFAHFFDVHWPYTAPAPYAHMYQNGDQRVDGTMASINLARRWLKSGNSWHQAPPTHRSRLSKLQTDWDQGMRQAEALDAEYCAEVSFCDHHLGRLIDVLKERGVYDRALIIVTSDHGETMSEHDNFFNHGRSVYDTELHVPLIVRFPDGWLAGTTINRLSSHVDLLPTILNWLGIEAPDGIDGQSFADLDDATAVRRGPIFAEATQPKNLRRSNGGSTWPNDLKPQCVRTDRFKFVSSITDSFTGLFDLQADPGEQHNLVDSNDQAVATVLKNLKTELDEWRRSARSLPAVDVHDRKHIEALRSLGYVGDAEHGQ